MANYLAPRDDTSTALVSMLRAEVLVTPGIGSIVGLAGGATAPRGVIVTVSVATIDVTKVVPSISVFMAERLLSRSPGVEASVG